MWRMNSSVVHIIFWDMGLTPVPDLLLCNIYDFNTLRKRLTHIVLREYRAALEACKGYGVDLAELRRGGQKISVCRLGILYGGLLYHGFFYVRCSKAAQPVNAVNTEKAFTEMIFLKIQNSLAAYYGIG